MNVYIRQGREYTLQVPDDFPPMEEWSTDHYDNIHELCENADFQFPSHTVQKCEIVSSFDPYHDIN